MDKNTLLHIVFFLSWFLVGAFIRWAMIGIDFKLSEYWGLMPKKEEVIQRVKIAERAEERAAERGEGTTEQQALIWKLLYGGFWPFIVIFFAAFWVQGKTFTVWGLKQAEKALIPLS